MKELIISNKFRIIFKHKHDSSNYEFDLAFRLDEDIIEQAWEHYTFLTGIKRFESHLLIGIIPDPNIIVEKNKQSSKPTITPKAKVKLIDCYLRIMERHQLDDDIVKEGRKQLLKTLSLDI